MTCANHGPSHSAPVPAAGAGSKVERYATIQLLSNRPLAWKHNMPPSCGSIKIHLCALETSNVSWITCCCTISVGAQKRISEIRGSIMWLGMTVLDLEVTLLMELSTAKRGERPSEMTTSNLPTAVRSNCCLSSARRPGTWGVTQPLKPTRPELHQWIRTALCHMKGCAWKTTTIFDTVQGDWPLKVRSQQLLPLLEWNLTRTCCDILSKMSGRFDTNIQAFSQSRSNIHAQA